MHIASYKRKQKQKHQIQSTKMAPSIKNQPLMPFENNGTLQKWLMANTPPKIDKYDTHKNDAL